MGKNCPNFNNLSSNCGRNYQRQLLRKPTPTKIIPLGLWAPHLQQITDRMIELKQCMIYTKIRYILYVETLIGRISYYIKKFNPNKLKTIFLQIQQITYTVRQII